jgi:hypothetical protein
MTTSTHICLGGLRDSIALLHATNDTIDGGAAVGGAAFWASALDEQLRAADSSYDLRRDRDARGHLLPGSGLCAMR